MTDYSGGQFFIGVVEDRNDPLMVGRVRVRVAGLHFHDKNILPTEDLPWALVMQPATSTSSMGSTGAGPAEGTRVVVIFNDYPVNQQPIVIGSIGGVPQEEQVVIDRFADTPLFKDEITPAGRPLPVSAEEVNANQIGPVTSPNPALASIVEQGQQESSRTGFGVVQTVLSGTADTFQTVGNVLSGINGVGSTYGIIRSEFENNILLSGNKDQAINRFVTLATQSGPLGGAIGALFNGRASLRSLVQDFGFSASNIKTAFNTIKEGGNIFGVLQNAETIASQLGSLVTGTGGLLDTVINEFNQVTLDGTLGGLRDDLGDLIGSEISSISGIVGGGVGQIQSAASALGLGNVTGGVQSFIGGLGSSVSSTIRGISPTNVASSLTGEFSSNQLADQNVGNLSATKEISGSEIDSTSFITIPEGQTPPVFGVYGGPNYGGASPVIELPVPADLSRFPNGGTGEIPTTPPPGATTRTGRASEGIKALLDACPKYGLNTKEQKAALLGIVGGECEWVPQAESAQYSSPDRLLQIFPSTFKGKRNLAERYCNWIQGNKGTREEFFNFVYDPANNGKQLGNKQPGDGGKFYGRGFIQLTGRSNYERYAMLSGYPIDKNPDLLINDPKISAEIAVLYLLDRVSGGVVPTAHPGYFFAAKRAVGNNSPDIAARKLAFYEYFYGAKTPNSYGYCEKEAGNSQNPYSFHGGLAGNEAGRPNNIGFQDPHRKYPLKRYVAEQETNRLARGVIRETVVPLKEANRTIGVPLPFKAGSFSQPHIPFGAQYPFNKVMETESGHIQEWDDTPGNERIHTYHRSGTFEEVDANGTKVTKIVGDGYTILDRNGFISIAGDANVTVSGNVNIFCQSDANIEVAGSAEMKVGGNFDVGVARDMNIAVEGNFSVWANGAMNLQSRKKGHIMTTEDNLYITSNKQMHIQTIDDMFVESFNNAHVKTHQSMHLLSLQQLHQKSMTDMFIETPTNYHLQVGDNAFTKTGSNHNVVAGSNAFITTGGTTHVKASGNVEIDGSITNINSGTAGSGSDAQSSVEATPSIKALIRGMVPPPLGVPLYPDVPPLSSTPPLGEEEFMYELPFETRTGAMVAQSREYIAQNGISNTYSSETASGSGGSGSIIASAKQQEILSMSTFTSDFRLSTHFTLGMMFSGGFNTKHRLVDQNGLTRQQIVANLASLCENILERYLEVLPDGIQGYNRKWFITSGYRMGTSRSDHAKGRACDIQLAGRSKPEHFELIKRLDKLVPYDQLLLEYKGAQSVWVHTGFRGDGQTTFGGGSNRGQAATVVVDSNKFLPEFRLFA